MYNWFEFTYRAMARLQKAAYWRQSCCFSSLANWPARQIVQREYTVFMARCSGAILSIFVNKPIAKWTTSSLTELFARFGYIWLSQETPKERNRRFLYMQNVQKYWTLKKQLKNKTKNLFTSLAKWILSDCTYEAKAVTAVATTTG